MKKAYYILIWAFVIGLYGCGKDERLDYTDPNAPAPAQVSAVKATATAGGATITYTLPSDPNLSYVKAVYEIQPGVSREAKSSIYANSLELVGFGDELSHEVKLYSIGKNEKESAPVSIFVQPKTPPVRSVFSNIKLTETFSGVNVVFQNPDKANLAIVVMVDSTGKNTWSTINTQYTNAVEGNFSVRGFKSEERKFGVFVRDRWNNKSDTLIKKLTPKFEIEIPKNLWTNLDLPNDQKGVADPAFKVEYIWDGKWASLGNQCYASPNASVLPQSLTIDLKQKVLMSRIKAHQAPNTHIYVGSAFKTFELWGSNAPNPDGSWDSWQKLGTFRSFKPSGLPLGQMSDQDRNYANFLGEDFDFDTPPPAVRYIRWKTTETYSSTGQVVIAELRLFGQIVP